MLKNEQTLEEVDVEYIRKRVGCKPPLHRFLTGHLEEEMNTDYESSESGKTDLIWSVEDQSDV